MYYLITFDMEGGVRFIGICITPTKFLSTVKLNKYLHTFGYKRRLVATGAWFQCHKRIK